MIEEEDDDDVVLFKKKMSNIPVVTLILENRFVCLISLLLFWLFPIIKLSTSEIDKEIDQRQFHVLFPERYAHLLKEDYEWAVENVPFIDFPENDDILIAYYYRWHMYRKRKFEDYYALSMREYSKCIVPSTQNL